MVGTTYLHSCPFNRLPCRSQQSKAGGDNDYTDEKQRDTCIQSILTSIVLG